jgi:hypothetical protein
MLPVFGTLPPLTLVLAPMFGTGPCTGFVRVPVFIDGVPAPAAPTIGALLTFAPVATAAGLALTGFWKPASDAADPDATAAE